MKASGKRYNVASEKKWTWEKPPVMCLYCPDRVTLKDSFRSEYGRGTWHVRCDPRRVRVVVEERQTGQDAA